MIEQQQIQHLIEQTKQGKPCDLDALIEASYPTLLKIAQGIRRQNFQATPTMDTVALVNETWLRFNQFGLCAEDEKHYYCLVAKMMRQLLSNHARKKNTQKRQKIENNDPLSINSSEDSTDWLIQLEQIISKLEEKHSRMVHVFQLRYFLGMTEKEVAKLLDLNERTIRRDWFMAKAAIQQMMV